MTKAPAFFRTAAIVVVMLALLATAAEVLRPTRSFELQTEAPETEAARDPGSIDWSDPAVLSELRTESGNSYANSVGGGSSYETYSYSDGAIASVDDDPPPPAMLPTPGTEEPILVPAPEEEVASASSGGGERLEIIASRLFVGPGEVPPEGYLAYGILAFPERPAGETLARGMMFCNAFLGTIPHSSEIAIPVDSEKQEVVTIWPMRTRGQAAEANRIARSRTCEKAVPNYGLFEAQRHIKAAIAAGIDIADEPGPFLLAWAPGSGFPKANARVLMADLSDVSSAGAARERFRRWMRQVERREDFWTGMPLHERIRRTLRDAADTHGPAIWRGAKLFFGLGGKESGDA
ncbi:hypothetical protein [Salipiger abyssi]|uniref:hypothetical protein n=1 Tax=Salipiger abyssi TaxID=1250539 RepID=UPI004059F234